jgi:hypothetical protein
MRRGQRNPHATGARDSRGSHLAMSTRKSAFRTYLPDLRNLHKILCRFQLQLNQSDTNLPFRVTSGIAEWL